ncbi:unnamed protein product [Strongylus vulgaris]|uniref:Glycoside hydrolase family 31 N-terminal domain-containing protein n=1 Tax=Strongylus vulgaris TaxID=40348 RepID=A0A3P7K9M0_STRVU|nr:unnamed protein product [Strongylus vulgaris]
MEYFYFTVTRKSTKEVLFDTSIGGLIFSDQFIQIATRLPSDAMYGWGENSHPTLKHNFNRYTSWAMFARDEWPYSEETTTKNLYGMHPFYMLLEPDGKAHGVFILNSNAQVILLLLPKQSKNHALFFLVDNSDVRFSLN